MAQQIPLSKADTVGVDQDDGTLAITDDVAYKRLVFVNIVLLGKQRAHDWVLIDTGVVGTAGSIRAAAAKRFGADRPPAAIVLTHGHFDHVGALEELSRSWDVPVYAHSLELDYLNGSAAYPPPDPSVGGGAMALLSPLYPRGPVNVAERLKALPPDGTVPCMPGWSWIHTPGHSVGHVSFWRESDRTLIVGDAFITTAGESAYATAVQAPELHGPPKYFTHDWQAAKASVASLAALDPELVVTGHGRAMQGSAMREALHRLAAGFDEIAVPTTGRYVDNPQRAADGSAYVRGGHH